MNHILERFKCGGFAINCQTEEQVIAVTTLLHKNNIEWCDGVSLMRETRWHTYESELCYYHERSSRGLSYCSCSWFKREGTEIMTATNFLQGFYEYLHDDIY